MKYIKKYEKLTWCWYAKIIPDKDVEYFYNKLKDSGILYKFYKANDENIIFKYVLSKNKYENNGWIIQQNDFFELGGKIPYNPEEFIKEYNLKMNMNKYNI